MSLKKLGGETAIYGIASVLGRMLNFVIVTPVLTDVLVSEDYGVVSVLFMWMGLLTALLVFRMDTVVFRYASRAGDDAAAVFRKAQRFVAIAVALVVGAGLLGSESVAEWMNYPDRAIYVQLFLLTVGFDALSAVPLARLRLHQRPWFFVAVNLGNVLLNLSLIVFMLYGFPKLGVIFGLRFQEQYLVAYYLVTLTIAAAVRYLALLIDGTLHRGYRPPEREHGTAVTSVPSLTEMLRYSLPLTLVGVAGIFNALSGPWIIKWFYGAGTTENLYWSGQFGAALKLAVFLNLVVTAYNYAAEPFFFRQAGKDLEQADRSLYADATRAYALIAAVACAGILLFLPWLQFFIDEGERVGLFILPYLLAANFCLGLYSNFSIAYKLTDKTYLGGAIAAVGSVICLFISIRFIDSYGIKAPAIAMLACYATMSVSAWLITRRIFPVDYPVWRILIYMTASAASVFFASTLDAGMWGNGAMFFLLLAGLGALEYNWIRHSLG